MSNRGTPDSSRQTRILDDFINSILRRFGAVEDRINNLESDYGTKYVKIATDNISNPPTKAELTALFGAPSSSKKGFVVVVDDAGGHANEYLIWCDGTEWFYTTGTKAV